MIKWINKKRNKKGFTLIELIVVIAILGILAAIAIPRLTGFQEKAKISADKSTYASLNSAIAVRVAESEIPDGNYDVTTDDKGAIIALYDTDKNLLESGAGFKLTDNQSKTFRWVITEGEITTAPGITDEGVVTATVGS